MRFREIERIVLNKSQFQIIEETFLKELPTPYLNRQVSNETCHIIKERSTVMNYVYPAVFYPEDDGKYSVVFPDLNHLATYGENLADAFAMAQEACGQYLFTSLRDGDVLPAPTPLDLVEKDEDASLVNLICVNLDEYARAYNDKAVKKTLSIPAWLNTACENYGINYSKVLQDALIAKIQSRS